MKNYVPKVENVMVGYEPPSSNLTGIAVGSGVAGGILLALAIGCVIVNSQGQKNYNKGFNDAMNAFNKSVSNVNINS